MAEIIDGKAAAEAVVAKVKKLAAELVAGGGHEPGDDLELPQLREVRGAAQGMRLLPVSVLFATCERAAPGRGTTSCSARGHPR